MSTTNFTPTQNEHVGLLLRMPQLLLNRNSID